jgi:hypothetical protein
MEPKNTRTDQDMLRDYLDAGETGNAARFLQFATKRDRDTERKYPDPRSKTAGKSGDWQLTRAHASDALRSGIIDPHSLLEIHIRDAFTEREGESIEDRQQRAIEVFGACLDAARNITAHRDGRNFFMLVDAAADYAIRIIEGGKFPTKAQVKKAAEKSTGIKGTQESEWTKILAHARLSFLEKGEQERRV